MVIELPYCTLYMHRLEGSAREHERRAVKALVKEAFGEAELAHADSGAPYIIGVAEHVSVSHGAGLAVLAVSDSAVGVDIEAPRSQLERVAGKFMRADDECESLLHAWTAKEAVYKAAGCEGITVHDISVSVNTARIPDGREFAVEYQVIGEALLAVAREI